MGIITAGVDEAGRGPLAGPVVAAAVILNPDKPIDGLKDSKKLSPQKREILSSLIKQRCLAFAIAQASVDEIDALNILQASLLAMQRAVAKLPQQPARVLVDGNHLPNLPMPAQAIVGGDNRELSISAASILAKVSRDHQMLTLDAQYPDYGFAQHKGYPTKQHINVLQNHGLIPGVYRKTFAPVKRLL